MEILAKDQIKDRVVEITKKRLADLHRHPFNPKFHTDQQAALVSRLLTQIGWAGSAIAWYSERNNGELTIFDAHLRQTLAPDFEATVIITDLTDAEADLMVALFDESSRMAEIDSATIEELITAIGDNHRDPLFEQALLKMAARGLSQADSDEDEDTPKNQDSEPRDVVPEQFLIVIECDSETHQLELLERLQKDGIECKALVS